MRMNAARTVRAKAPVRRRTNWSVAKDRALVWGLIRESDNAMQEFCSRFDDLMTKRIRATLARFSFALATLEMVEAIKEQVFAQLVNDHHRLLRGFHPRQGTLANWLSRVSHACAVRHVEDLSNLPTYDE